MSGKTGTNTGTIIHTRDSKHYAIQKKEDTKKKKKANICIECKDNNDGYCNKHKEWCSQVNHICNGTKDPYEYKLFKKKSNPKNKKKVKPKKKNKKVTN